MEFPSKYYKITLESTIPINPSQNIGFCTGRENYDIPPWLYFALKKSILLKLIYLGEK